MLQRSRHGGISDRYRERTSRLDIYGAAKILRALHVDIVDECIDCIVGKIMLDRKEGERPARFGGSGLLPFQTCQIVHPDNRRDGLPAPFNDDMLAAMLYFPDECGEMRLRLNGTDTLRNHHRTPHARNDQQVRST
jgi:hypothetical protein